MFLLFPTEFFSEKTTNIFLHGLIIYIYINAKRNTVTERVQNIWLTVLRNIKDQQSEPATTRLLFIYYHQSHINI